MVVQMNTARPKIVQSLFLCTFVIVGFLFLQHQHQHQHRQQTSGLSKWAHVPKYRDAIPQIAKVSMLYGKPNRLFQRAIKSHERHAAIHGYPVHILRNQVAHDYWNKPSYLISLLLQELEKDPGDRVEWLMWINADSIVMNMDLPVSIFLPPHDQEFNKMFDNKNLLVTKDRNGLNTGIFFIRVRQWSVQFMAKTLAYAMYNPEVELGFSADQRAMEILINETEFRDHTTFIPRHWINTYINEVQPGHLLVHFAGLVERDWHMKHWLNLAEGPQKSDWIMPFRETEYNQEILKFWKRLKACNDLVDRLAVKLGEIQSQSQSSAGSDLDSDGSTPVSGTVPVEVVNAVTFLRDTCWYRSDDDDAIKKAKTEAEMAIADLLT